MRLRGGLLVLMFLAGSSVEAIQRTVYRYRSVSGEPGVGVDPPPGATILSTVGTIDVPIGQLLLERGESRLIVPPTNIWREVRREPVASGLCVLLVLLVAVLSLRAIPPLFSTHELTLTGAAHMLVAILAGLTTLVLLGRGVELLAVASGWGPVEGLADIRDAVGYALYAAVVVYAFWRRLAPRPLTATLLAGGWLALLVIATLGLWAVVMPSLTPLM